MFKHVTTLSASLLPLQFVSSFCLSPQGATKGFSGSAATAAGAADSEPPCLRPGAWAEMRIADRATTRSDDAQDFILDFTEDLDFKKLSVKLDLYEIQSF
jgi:hypothetical protein